MQPFWSRSNESEVPSGDAPYHVPNVNPCHPTPDTMYADLSPVRFGRSRNVYGMIATEYPSRPRNS